MNEPLKLHDKIVQQADGTWRRERKDDPPDMPRGEVLPPTASQVTEMIETRGRYRRAPYEVMAGLLDDLGI